MRREPRGISEPAKLSGKCVMAQPLREIAARGGTARSKQTGGAIMEYP